VTGSESGDDENGDLMCAEDVDNKAMRVVIIRDEKLGGLEIRHYTRITKYTKRLNIKQIMRIVKLTGIVENYMYM